MQKASPRSLCDHRLGRGESQVGGKASSRAALSDGRIGVGADRLPLFQPDHQGSEGAARKDVHLHVL